LKFDPGVQTLPLTKTYLRRRGDALPELQPRRRADGTEAARRLQDRCGQKGLASLKPNKGWRRRFEDPRPLPRGRQLVTLEDAGKYITKLPKVEQQLDEWQTATEALIMAAEGRGPLLHARVGMLRALNRHVERVFNPDRKDHHWGRRKLARDQ
jgi:hypothetical protein